MCDGIVNFATLLWQKCLSVVVDIWRFQTIRLQGKIIVFSCSKAERREVQTTVSISPCLPIILCGQLTYSDQKNSTYCNVQSSIYAHDTFFHVFTHKYCTMDLLLTYYHTVRFWYCYIPINDGHMIQFCLRRDIIRQYLCYLGKKFQQKSKKQESRVDSICTHPPRGGITCSHTAVNHGVAGLQCYKRHTFASFSSLPTESDF